MLSVVIPVQEDASHLPFVLNSLVSAAASGLVRDVVIVDHGGTRQAYEIADAAGCYFSSGHANCGAALKAGADQAKSEWILFLYPKSELQAGWEQHVQLFLDRVERSQAHSRVASFRLSVDGFGMSKRVEEVFAFLRSRLIGLPRGEQGLLISKQHYEKIGGHRPLEKFEDLDLLRRIGQNRITLLKSDVFVLGGDERQALSLGTLWNGICLTLYKFGLPNQIIRKLYI